VFPHFIFEVLPPGVAGVVMSGVFAAAMSTMDSSLNAVSSVVVTDVVKRCVAPNLKDKQYLLIGRVVSVCTAALMVGMALVLGGLHKASTINLSPQLYILSLFFCAIEGGGCFPTMN
jgi:SSS family solute:Na+ symporter